MSKEKTSQQAALFAINSGKRLLNAGDLDGAISHFRSAINAMPNSAQAHYQLGIALTRKGEKTEAAQEFRQASALDSKLQPPQ
jgi:Flp pilus assembly protein TadD